MTRIFRVIAIEYGYKNWKERTKYSRKSPVQVSKFFNIMRSRSRQHRTDLDGLHTNIQTFVVVQYQYYTKYNAFDSVSAK